MGKGKRPPWPCDSCGKRYFPPSAFEFQMRVITYDEDGLKRNRVATKGVTFHLCTDCLMEAKIHIGTVYKDILEP